MDRSRVLVYSDDHLFRFGVIERLKREDSSFDLIETASSEDLGPMLPDCQLLILELVIAGRLTFKQIETIRKQNHNLGILVVAKHSETACAERCLMAGANGYFNPQQPLSELSAAVRTVLSGELYLSQAMQTKLFTGAATSSLNRIGDLTRRELDVFFMLGHGHSTREIASTLGLSVKTIETYREKTKQKLGFKSSAALTRYALEASVFRFDEGHEDQPMRHDIEGLRNKPSR